MREPVTSNQFISDIDEFLKSSADSGASQHPTQLFRPLHADVLFRHDLRGGRGGGGQAPGLSPGVRLQGGDSSPLLSRTLQAPKTRPLPQLYPPRLPGHVLARTIFLPPLTGQRYYRMFNQINNSPNICYKSPQSFNGPKDFKSRSKSVDKNIPHLRIPTRSTLITSACSHWSSL